jgi:transcriptional regulator with XRE-family HTH domain
MNMLRHETFGTIVRSRRTELGLTRRQLSQIVVCAEVTLRKIEDDDRRPSPQMAQMLAEALRFTPTEREHFITTACTRQIRPFLSRRQRPTAVGGELLALAEDSFARYPDAWQQRTFDALHKRLTELRALLRQLLRMDTQSAMRLAGLCSEFWAKRNHLTEGRGWLEQTLLLDVTPTEARALALFGAGRMAAFQADHSHARYRLDECAGLCERLHLDTLWARVVQQQGMIALWGEWQLDEAAKLYSGSHERFRVLGDDLHSAHAQCDLALTLAYASPEPDLPRARHLASDSLACFRARHSDYGVAYALHVLTQVETVANRISEAEACETQALALFRALNSPRDVAWSLAHLGDLALLRGSLEQARDYREQSLALFNEIGEKQAVCVSLHALAQIAREQGDLAQASLRLTAGLQTALDLQMPYVLAHGFNELAGIRLAMHCPADAALFLGAGNALSQRCGRAFPDHEAARFAAWTGEARAALGDQAYEAATQRGAALSIQTAVGLAVSM